MGLPRGVVRPDSVRTLCRQAFLNFDAEEIVLSRGLVSIGAFCKDAQIISSQLSYSVFGGAKINRLVIPSSVKLIGMFTFFGCKTLSNVVFEEGGSCVIEDCAFACCPISDVSLPASCINVGESVFDLPKPVRMHQGTSISEHSLTAVLVHGSIGKPYDKYLTFENKDAEIADFCNFFFFCPLHFALLFRLFFKGSPPFSLLLVLFFFFKSSLLWERVLGLRPDRWEQV